MMTRSALAASGVIVLYVLAAFRVGGIGSLEPVTPDAPCPATLEASNPGSPAVTILQGNAWMLPARPLLFPYAFSPDRRERLERLLGVVQTCQPHVVLLQEIFEVSMVEALERNLPGYEVLTSGGTGFWGSFNASGLVTIVRLPVRDVRFRPFAPLPEGSRRIERLARKGALAVDVDAPGGPATLVNVHLYASRDGVGRSVTRRQLDEVVDLVQEEEVRGRRVLAVSGDFNLDRLGIETLLPPLWRVSDHGPTFDPPTNPYTVRGSNNRPSNHEDRRLGRGLRTLDFLLLPHPERFAARSWVLGALLSDHYYLMHRIEVGGS